jgi:hypothetical protein
MTFELWKPSILMRAMTCWSTFSSAGVAVEKICKAIKKAVIFLVHCVGIVFPLAGW